MFLIKKVVDLLVEPLLYICNLSLNRGVFPKKLKIAKVTPIFKKGQKENINNYRPISVLPTFSKLIEKIVYHRLSFYLDSFDVIGDNQYGFREGRSTTAAVLSLTDYILRAFDDGKFVVGVFLDLTKAFETVNHNILLKKLEYIGVRGVALRWFQSYLTDRKQYVMFNGSKSDSKQLFYSVPQGSILGPLLFNLYINDLTSLAINMKITLFADDSCFYLANKNLNTLINTINSDLLTVDNWLKCSRLTLNLDKFHYIIFSRRKKIPPDLPNISIDDHSLKSVNETLFLGITITNNLSWKKHIKIVVNKLYKHKSVLFLTRKYLSRSTMLTLYYSLIYP